MQEIYKHGAWGSSSLSGKLLWIGELNIWGGVRSKLAISNFLGSYYYYGLYPPPTHTHFQAYTIVIFSRPVD